MKSSLLKKTVTWRRGCNLQNYHENGNPEKLLFHPSSVLYVKFCQTSVKIISKLHDYYVNVILCICNIMYGKGNYYYIFET